MSKAVTDILAIIIQQTVAEIQVMPFYRMKRQDEDGTLGSHSLTHSGGLHQDSDTTRETRLRGQGGLRMWFSLKELL